MFDYRRRRGVLDARLQLPGGRLVLDRADFWNSVETHHRRQDAVVAREVVVALPAELDAAERAQLAFDFACEIADEFGVAVDCALHAPSRGGDDRNHHAHMLLSACGVSPDGVLGKKAERLDPIVCHRKGQADSVSWLRPRWQGLVNRALERKGAVERVDHRSFKVRGIDRHPTVHIGKKSVAARGREGWNARLRALNARALMLEEQVSKLTRMKARLAARTAAAAVPPPPAPIVENRLSDLWPWRRRMASQQMPHSQPPPLHKPRK